MEEGWVYLNICHVFANYFFQKQMIYCSFFVDGGGGGLGSQYWSFWEDVINIWALNGLKLQPIQLSEAVASYSASSQIHFDCIENNPQHPFPLPIAPLPPFHWSSNQKNLLISVGNKFFTWKNVVTY